MTARLALAGVTLVALLTSSGAWSSSAQLVLPAPVTLSGIAGVKPGMGIAEIRRRWGLQIPYYERASGSSLVGESIVCAGAMKGVASFLAGGLLSVEFTGAKTDAHVGIGSSLAQLRRAYGRALTGSQSDFYVIAKTPPPRIAIHFVLYGGDRVNVIVWGRYGDIGPHGRYPRSSLVRVSC